MAEERSTVSYSELNSGRHCGLKWRLAYRDRWVPRVPVGPSRILGTAWHRVMELHYQTLRQVQDEIRLGRYPELQPPHPGHPAWVYPKETDRRIWDVLLYSEQATGLLSDLDSGDQTDNQQLLVWMYEGYREKWGLDPTHTILATEFRLTQPLPDPSGATSRYDLKAKLDLITQSTTTGEIVLWDHKSGQSRPNPDTSSLDDQFGLYTWALRQQGRAVGRSIRNWAKTYRTKAPQGVDDRFSRQLSDRSDSELDQLALDAWRTAEWLYTWDYQQYGGWPVTPDPEQCRRFCDYSKAHMAARRGITTVEAYLSDTGWEQRPDRH